MKAYLFALFFLAACSQYPADPKDTLKRATHGVLRVGYSENPPWTIATADGPEGIEADLIKAFAKKLNASIFWQQGTENILFQKLEKNELDIVIAGLTNKTPWKSKKIGLTRTYLKIEKEKHVMAVTQGENRFLIELEKHLYLYQSKQP